MNRIPLSVLALAALAVAACQGVASNPSPGQPGAAEHPATSTPMTRTAGALKPTGRASDWVVTDTYVDPEFGRRTVICLDAGGDLMAATGYIEVDVPGARIGAPCPEGRVLDEGLFAAPTGGGR